MGKKTAKSAAKAIKNLDPKAADAKGGKRADWTIGHVTSVKFPK